MSAQDGAPKAWDDPVNDTQIAAKVYGKLFIDFPKIPTKFPICRRLVTPIGR